MSDIDLAGYVANLTQWRDRAHRDALTAKADGDLGARRAALAEYGAYALAISSLHTYTTGQFGTEYAAQPSPYGSGRDPESSDDYWTPEPMSQASAEFMSRQVSS
jgi:hypothetical protein